MSRPLRIDTFPIHDELDMLECRLTEIFDAVDYVVAVEADVTHQDSPKPFYVTENLARFDAFKDMHVANFSRASTEWQKMNRAGEPLAEVGPIFTRS